MFAFSGVLNRPPGEKRDPAFLEYAVDLAAGDGKKRVCFIPTATGDSPSAIEAVAEVFVGHQDVDFSVLTLFTQPSVPDVEAHLMAQDVLLVGGGSVVNLMAVWRAHGLAPVLRECWEAGIVLACGMWSAVPGRNSAPYPDTRTSYHRPPLRSRLLPRAWRGPPSPI